MQFTIHEAPPYAPPPPMKSRGSGGAAFLLGLLMGVLGCGLGVIVNEDAIKKTFRDADRPPAAPTSAPSLPAASSDTPPQ